MKNRTKKAISFITALMLISGSLNVMPHSINTVSAQSIISDTINITIPEDTFVTNGMFTVTYDAEKLKLENADAAHYSLGGMTTMVNKNIEGKVVIGFVNTSELNVGGKAVSISFSRIGDSSEDISELCSLTVNEFVTIDDENNDIKVDSENIKLEKANKFYIEQIKAQKKGQYSLLIDTPREQDITNGILTVKYDSSRLKFEECTTGMLHSPIMYEANEVSKGVLKISFVCTDESIAKNFALTFSGIKEGDAEISVSADELFLTDADGTSEQIELTETSYTVSISELALPESDKAKVGIICGDGSETPEVFITFSENTNATNGTMHVIYDASHLSFGGYEICDVLSGAMVEANDNGEGKIDIVFISSDPITAGGNALKLNFSSLKEASSEVSVNIYDTDNGLQSITADGTVTQIELAETSSSCTVKTGSKTDEAALGISCDDSKPEVYIDFPSDTGVTNGILTVKYDAKHIKFDSFEKCDVLENAMVEVNEISDGTLSIAFVNSEEINSSGNALKIVFTILKGGTSEVSVSADEFSSVSLDGTSKDIAVKASSCTVKTTASYEEKYDLNGDGAVTAADIIVLAKYILSQEAMNEETFSKADINGNGKVDIFDFIRLKRYMLNA